MPVDLSLLELVKFPLLSGVVPQLELLLQGLDARLLICADLLFQFQPLFLLSNALLEVLFHLELGRLQLLLSLLNALSLTLFLTNLALKLLFLVFQLLFILLLNLLSHSVLSRL